MQVARRVGWAVWVAWASSCGGASPSAPERGETDHAYALLPRQDGAEGVSPHQGLWAVWTPEVTAVATAPNGPQLVVRLTHVGRGDTLQPVRAGQVVAGRCGPVGGAWGAGRCLNTVTVSRGGLVEWWENRAEGLEQGFTMEEPPAGEGPLQFDVQVDGAEVAWSSSAAALLQLSDGSTVRYDHLAAWDARGVALRAWMERTDDGLRLLVDDADAVGAVTLDPLLSSSIAGSAESDQAQSAFARSFKAAGDVDGDGYGDVVVGAFLFDNGETDEGRAFVYQGTPSGLNAVSAWTAESDLAGARFGYAVAPCGDVNRDGYDDVIVGGPRYARSSALLDEGFARLYLGSAAGLGATAAWTFYGNAVGGRAGTAVSTAGDVNGDGYADAIVGAPETSRGQTAEGRAFVFLGGPSGLNTSPGWTAESNVPFARFGTFVAGGGDINGDGFDDVVVGAPLYAAGQTEEGRIYVYYGSAAGLPRSPSWVYEPNVVNAMVGVNVAILGDVNGDGFADFATERRLFLGGPSGPTGPVGSTTGPRWLAAGDVNGDGFDDGVSAPSALHLGSASGLAAAPAYVNPVAGAGEYAGDVNGDGYADIVYGFAVWSNPEPSEGRVYVRLGGCDLDGDGLCPPDDCDDTRLDVGAPSTAYYADADGDGYGDATQFVWACQPPDGFVADPTDCDDAAASVSPAASEVCDVADVDEDCDGLAEDADPSVSGLLGFYVDVDGDGFGVGPPLALGCSGPDGLASAPGDCDDADPTVSPGAAEICDVDDVDEDCDGWVDDADPSVTGTTVFYVDGDGDGFGSDVTALFCAPPEGYVNNNLDCDDANDAIHPLAVELCDPANLDEDCDGLADDLDTDPVGTSAAYEDGDGDGYGGSRKVVVCDPPVGFVALRGDCDDGDRAIQPGALEACDAGDRDEDCNGLADNADPASTGKQTFYADTDGDGFGSAAKGRGFCDPPTGFVVDGTDCVDDDRTISPAAVERCTPTGVDDDCDGRVDEADDGVVDAVVGYLDEDGDGYAGGRAVSYCSPPAGIFASSTDCDDLAADVHPGAVERCDDGGRDEDCDGLEGDGDPSVAGQPSWFADLDADGFGAGLAVLACSAPLGTVANASDCDDDRAEVRPDAAEICDDADVDEDCDGLAEDADAAPLGAIAWYADGDGDGFGAGAPRVACDAQPGWVLDGNDCDDGAASYRPGAPETDCTDPADYNCDGAVGFVDADGDGFAACAECDDGEALVRPDADEVCNGVDDDCDGGIDLGAVDAPVWYADRDGDGFTTSETSVACAPPEGYLGEQSAAPDCDDAQASVHPGAVEIEGDGRDQDCDGTDAVSTDSASPPTETDSGGHPVLPPTPRGPCGCAASGTAMLPAAFLVGLTTAWRRTRRPLVRGATSSC